MAYNFSGVKNTTELNDVVKFIHYYAKVKEANPSMVDEKLIAQKVENDHGVLHSEDQLKLAKEINNGVMPKIEDIQRIISEFQAYIKQKMQDEEDEFNKADAEFKTAEAIQQEGENAADQLDEMHRQRRNTRVKQGVLGAVLGFGACALLGPVVAPLLGLASLGTSATLLISAGASGYFAKFRADRSIKEAGLDDRTLIKELQKKVKEATSQYNNYKSKEQVKNFAESNRNTTQREFQNYEQIGSNYEVLQENERNDAHNRLLQLQNDINSVKNTTMEGMLASGGMGVADYVDDKTKATTASSEITAIIQQLQNLPLDSNFQKEMARLVAEAEKKKAEIDAIDIPNKKYGDEVKSAIQALYNEYESITGLVSGLSDGLRNNADVTAQLNACENIYNPITSSLDGEKVGAIESKLNAFKTEGAKLKGIVRTAWITEQNPESLPESTPEEKAYKTAVANAKTWNDRAKTAPADQKANAEAMAELTFMKARLQELEAQRAKTGKKELWYNDSGRNVVIDVKVKIESAINGVDAELSDVYSQAKTPADALAEATNIVNINDISGYVRLLAGKGPTQAQRDTTDRELGELITKLMAELSQCKTNIQSVLSNKDINGLVQLLNQEVEDLKKKIEDENSPMGYKYKVKQAKSQADLDRIKKDAESERDEIKNRLDKAEENAKDFANKIKEIEEAYDNFRITYIENRNYANENNIIDKDRFLELKKEVSGVYINLSSRTDNKLIDINQAEADLQALTTKISENEAEIKKLKQPVESIKGEKEKSPEEQKTEETPSDEAADLQQYKDNKKETLKKVSLQNEKSACIVYATDNLKQKLTEEDKKNLEAIVTGVYNQTLANIDNATTKEEVDDVVRSFDGVNKVVVDKYLKMKSEQAKNQDDVKDNGDHENPGDEADNLRPNPAEQRMEETPSPTPEEQKPKETPAVPTENPIKNNSEKSDKDKSITDIFNEVYTKTSSDGNPQGEEDNGQRGQGESKNKQADARIHVEWFPGLSKKGARTTEEKSENADSENGGEHKVPVDNSRKDECIKYIKGFRKKHYLQASEVDGLVRNDGNGSDINRLIAICKALRKWENMNVNNAEAENDGDEPQM